MHESCIVVNRWTVYLELAQPLTQLIFKSTQDVYKSYEEICHSLIFNLDSQFFFQNDSKINVSNVTINHDFSQLLP